MPIYEPVTPEESIRNIVMARLHEKAEAVEAELAEIERLLAVLEKDAD